MNSYNKDSIKIAAPAFITFIFIFLFLVIQGSEPVNTAEAEEEIASGLKDESFNEGDILASLDSKTISTGELLRQYSLYSLITRFSRTSLEGLTVNSYLDYYISELLLLNEADVMKINISLDQAKKEKERHQRLFRFPDETFVKWLDKYSLTMEDAERYFKNNLILKRFYGMKFGSEKIPDEEISEYYKVHNEYYNSPAKAALSHILICHKESHGCTGTISKDKAKQFAESLRNDLTPENFAEKAKRYSYDRTGQIGGSLGVVTKGSAIPSLDKAAFSLKTGEISDPIESEHGYHILYVTNKVEELSIPLEEARESIEYTLEEEHITSELLKYAEQLKQNAKIIKYSDADRKDSHDLKAQADKKKSAPAVKQYSTFKATGKDIYRNSKGQPVILMFSHKGCPYCEWIGETFDDLVMEYVDKGLIEAHHYDSQIKDDLLTFETETEIPQEYLDFSESKSQPYFLFGGMYERVGAGYFSQDDLYAEEMEMTQIIDDLLR